MANSPTDIVSTKSDVPTTSESNEEAAGGDLTFREALQTVHEPEVSPSRRGETTPIRTILNKFSCSFLLLGRL